MSTLNDCPELETLFLAISENDETSLAHARSCPACAAILEDHRQLEKDLYRLVDPLPPMDFTAKVMAKVEAAPAPVSSELKAGVGIFVVSVSLFAAFMFSGLSLGEAGVAVAEGLFQARGLLIAVGSALQTLWGTAALPLVIVSLLVLTSTVFGIRRLAMGSAQSA